MCAPRSRSRRHGDRQDDWSAMSTCSAIPQIRHLRPRISSVRYLPPVPVGVERLIDAHFRFLRAALAQVHEDLVFDAARGVGRELDVLVRLEGVDGLDEADRADRDQVLDVDARVFKPARDVHHQPQVVLDEQGGGLLAPGGERPNGLLLGRAVERGSRARRAHAAVLQQLQPVYRAAQRQRHPAEHRREPQRSRRRPEGHGQQCRRHGQLARPACQKPASRQIHRHGVGRAECRSRRNAPGRTAAARLAAARSSSQFQSSARTRCPDRPSWPHPPVRGQSIRAGRKKTGRNPGVGSRPVLICFPGKNGRFAVRRRASGFAGGRGRICLTASNGLSEAKRICHGAAPQRAAMRHIARAWMRSCHRKRRRSLRSVQRRRPAVILSGQQLAISISASACRRLA